jgi:hypothetical protein
MGGTPRKGVEHAALFVGPSPRPFRACHALIAAAARSLSCGSNRATMKWGLLLPSTGFVRQRSMEIRFAYRVGIVAFLAAVLAAEPGPTFAGCAISRQACCCCRQDATSCGCRPRALSQGTDGTGPLAQTGDCRCSRPQPAVPARNPPNREERRSIETSLGLASGLLVRGVSPAAGNSPRLPASPGGNRRQALLCVWRD